MNLFEAITVFERAAAAKTPFPSWASIEEALSVIESDKNFLRYFAVYRSVAESPSWESIKQGCTGNSFVEVVKSAAVLSIVLQLFQKKDDFSKWAVAESSVNF